MSGSQPLSKRKDASVLRPCLFDVFLTETGLKYALSRNTFTVFSVTPLFTPPNTPAIHIGSFVLQIIRSEEESVLSTSSRVTNLVPSAQKSTTTSFPSIISASNACIGWPISIRI